MRTSADEVSIHAVSPESIFAASSARATAARASTAANASEVQAHQYPAPNDRCLLSIFPPELEEMVEQRWCHDQQRGVNRERAAPSAAARAAAARFQGAACCLCSDVAQQSQPETEPTPRA